MITLLALALLSFDPNVTSSQSNAAPVPAVTKAAEEKKICRIDRNDSSSRLRKRVCMTPTEWERAAAGKDSSDIKSMSAH